MPSEKEIKEILACIEAAFPFVDKPKREEILPEDAEPTEANWIFRELDKHSGKELPEEAINYLYDEFPFLTARGIEWILPSYLRTAVRRDSDHKVREVVEYLIYHLDPSEEFAESTREQFSFLNDTQLACLLKVLDFWLHCETWETWADDLTKAVEFVRRLKVSSGER